MPDDLERTLSDYEERERQDRNAAKAALLTLVDQLGTAGVSRLCATFSGYGDEGSIEGIEFLDAEGQPVRAALGEQFPNLEETFCVLLPPGFEQNEGSSGTVTLDVEQGRVVVDVDWNVTTTENQCYEV